MTRRLQLPSGPHFPVRVADYLLGERRHLCAFFNSREDEYGMTLPFIKDGFARGDRAFHLIDPARRDDHVQRLEAAGIDTVATQRSGQLELHHWEDTYLSGGYFDPDSWLSLVEEALISGRRRGFPMTRMIAHMEWALEDRVGCDRLVEYEARVNHVWPHHQDAVICTYDLRRWGGQVVIDVMRTHPVIIIDGILRENPFYVEPDEFLAELRRHEAKRAGSAGAAV